MIADFGLLIIEAELMEEKLLMDLKNDDCGNEILFMIADFLIADCGFIFRRLPVRMCG